MSFFFFVSDSDRSINLSTERVRRNNTLWESIMDLFCSLIYVFTVFCAFMVLAWIWRVLLFTANADRRFEENLRNDFDENHIECVMTRQTRSGKVYGSYVYTTAGNFDENL